jgi:membrane-bound metal-dependent hydrolase YbcI (DUF457 family)
MLIEETSSLSFFFFFPFIIVIIILVGSKSERNFSQSLIVSCMALYYASFRTALKYGKCDDLLYPELLCLCMNES